MSQFPIRHFSNFIWSTQQICASSAYLSTFLFWLLKHNNTEEYFILMTWILHLRRTEDADPRATGPDRLDRNMSSGEADQYSTQFLVKAAKLKHEVHWDIMANALNAHVYAIKWRAAELFQLHRQQKTLRRRAQNSGMRGVARVALQPPREKTTSTPFAKEVATEVSPVVALVAVEAVSDPSLGAINLVPTPPHMLTYPVVTTHLSILSETNQPSTVQIPPIIPIIVNLPDKVIARSGTGAHTNASLSEVRPPLTHEIVVKNPPDVNRAKIASLLCPTHENIDLTSDD
jgi:hypothetical protein